MKNKIIFSLLATILLVNGSIFTANAENLSDFTNYSLHLAITPPNIEAGEKTHPIGYVYVLNKNGVPISSDSDIEIKLESANPSIASVPSSVTLLADEEFARFDVTTSNLNGETTISATYQDDVNSKKIKVGSDENQLPDDLILGLTIPSEIMHVNSNMPFSVYLKTSDGTIIRAPFDIPVNLEYDSSLASTDSDVLIIEQGTYYAWGTIRTLDKVGNTFLRATQLDTQLDTATSIRITSSLPSAINIDVYPKMLPADIDRKLHIFVSLEDSQGNPVVASRDVPFEIFTNKHDFLGEEIDDLTRENRLIIPKGQFGKYFEVEFDTASQVETQVMVGASAEGYGVSTDAFETVREIINLDTKDVRLIEKIKDRAVWLFGPKAMPSNATAIFSYQIVAVETDDKDEEIRLEQEGLEQVERPDPEDEEDFEEYDLLCTEDASDDKCDDYDEPIIRMDQLPEDFYYPITASENYQSQGYIQLLGIVSSDENLIRISKIGTIESGYSIGTAEVSSTERTGSAMISANIDDVGSSSLPINVVNVLGQKEARLFSPVGTDAIIFDRNGNFDMFLVAIDGSGRPKVLKEDARYLVTPTNGVIGMKKDTTFSFAKLRSDSFSVEEGGSITLKVAPIGENADLSLGTTSKFSTQPSSHMEVLLPVEGINSEHKNQIGVVQLLDSLDNPITPTQEVRTKIVSSNTNIVEIIEDSTIPSGLSYGTFPIVTTGQLGNAIIGASAKGVIGSEASIQSLSDDVKLEIYNPGFDSTLILDEPTQLKLYVDDDNAESVQGAELQLTNLVNVTANPQKSRTSSDGSATFIITPTGNPANFEVVASAEGYLPDEQTIDLEVEVPITPVVELDLPDWVIYVVIAAVAMVGALVAIFLRKMKQNFEEDWEEEEI